MEHFNRTLFLLLNASVNPPVLLLGLARMLAVQAIWLVPLTLAAGWLRGAPATRAVMLRAAAAGLLGLSANQAIGLVWPHHRPFALGLGHSFLAHAADSSFPSDHLTLLWAVAFSLLTHASTRRVGLFLALLGLPVAWARIYLGVHFPLDMAGAAGVAAASALGLLRCRRLFEGPVYAWALAAYRLLFAPLGSGHGRGRPQ